jgi:uncharacterized protein (DUF1810 family)
MDESQHELLRLVRQQAARVEQAAARLRRGNHRSIYVGLIAGALATFVAGLTAVKGAPLIEVEAAAKALAWRWTCGISAALTLVATLATGLQKSLALPDRQAAATACLGRLRALELALSVRGLAAADAAREYEAILAQHVELLAE